LLSGKIDNAKGKSLSVTRGDFEQTINLNDDGTFADTLHIEPGFYALSHGRESTTAFLKPGYNVSVSINTPQFDESIKYMGVGSENNNYLAKKFLNNEASQGNDDTFYALGEKEFKQKVEDLYNNNLTALNNLKDKDFVALEKKDLLFQKYQLLNRYETYHAHYAKIDGFKASDDFLPEGLKSMDFTNAANYNMYASYRSLAMNHVMDDIFNKIGDDYQSTSPEDFSILKNIKNPEFKNDIIRQNGVFLVSPGNPNMESLYNFFMSNITDNKLKAALTEKFNKNKDLVMGKPSPQFNDYENHKGGTVSLSDLKGKYVYVDVWATWCGPCKREIPSLKKVEKEFHGKNIQFVSTSIDVAKDHEKWVNMVNEKSLGGLQLFADNDWNSKFVQDYAIQGIPRFILIDPKGNIVSADAPRPSNPKLETLLNDVLPK
jgi:thiol-disulfide isomerase/thioredoxin